MLEAKSLKRATIPSSLLEHPSPGNIQSTRLALHVNDDDSSCWVYIASGCGVYKLEISMQGSLVNKGKESLLIPEQTQVINSSLVNRCPHRSEVQSIALADTESNGCLILGSVDSYGHLIVSKLDDNGKDVDRLSFSVLPQDCGVGEGGWSGLCFSPRQWSMAAVARSFCKTVDIYDQDIHLKTLRTLWYPSSLTFMQNLSSGSDSSILAVTEGCQLTIWDLRIKENGGCLHRISGSIGDIFYAVCYSSAGIAVGGADRTVTIYDPRRWSALSRWVHCSKYEITGLAFSSVDSDYIYIQGVDYEAFCGQWKESKKVFSFRGDSNWLGFSKCSNRDVLGAWCDSGSIFVADVDKANGVLDEMPATDYQGSFASFSHIGRSLLSLRRDQIHSMEATQDAAGQELELEAFQRQVTERFRDLSSAGSDDLLSLSWIQKLLDVFLCCHDEFRTILFNNRAYIHRAPMDRLISEYFERSVKALDVCNAIRDGIEQIRQWNKQIEIVLCALEKQKSLGEGQFRRAKKALVDLAILMLDEKDSNSAVAHRNRSFGRSNLLKDRNLSQFRSLSWSVSRSWSAARQLQAIGNLAAPRTNEIMATMDLPWQGLHTHFSIPRQFVWAIPILSLHERILEESKKRDRRNSCGLLREIHQIEICARRMNELSDSVQFPLTEEREGEVRQRVEEVGLIFEAVKDGLTPLECQVREVFHRIVRSRTEGLDSFARGNYPQ
ncbi:hypothetical protein NMG60_11017251 [Bertholletia excelsa]